MTIGTTIFVPKFLNNYTLNIVCAVSILQHCMHLKQFIFILRLAPSVPLCLEFAFVRDVGSGRSYPTRPVLIELMQVFIRLSYASVHN